MVSHYDIPSGTSVNSNRTPTYKAKYDVKTGKWTATVKLDSTLSQFSVSKPNSVTVTRSGSNMTITADKAEDLKNVVFTLTKTKGKYVEHIDECSPLILSGGSDVQEMVVSCYEDKDPVKAYLKVQISTGSAELDKTFTDFFGNAQTATDELKRQSSSTLYTLTAAVTSMLKQQAVTASIHTPPQAHRQTQRSLH